MGEVIQLNTISSEKAREVHFWNIFQEWFGTFDVIHRELDEFSETISMIFMLTQFPIVSFENEICIKTVIRPIEGSKPPTVVSGDVVKLRKDLDQKMIRHSAEERKVLDYVKRLVQKLLEVDLVFTEPYDLEDGRTLVFQHVNSKSHVPHMATFYVTFWHSIPDLKDL